MKKTIVVLAILFAASAAYGMGNRSYNANRFGSDDKQRKDHTVIVDPDRPVHPVPEPATIYMIGAGLVGLGLWVRRR